MWLQLTTCIYTAHVHVLDEALQIQLEFMTAGVVTQELSHLLRPLLGTKEVHTAVTLPTKRLGGIAHGRAQIHISEHLV